MTFDAKPFCFIIIHELRIAILNFDKCRYKPHLFKLLFNNHTSFYKITQNNKLLKISFFSKQIIFNKDIMYSVDSNPNALPSWQRDGTTILLKN